jgi:hypothetical protein
MVTEETSDDISFQEFKQAVLDVSKELRVKEEELSYNDDINRNGRLVYYAYGASDSYYFVYYANKYKNDESIEVTIDISESSPPEDKMVSFKDQVTGFRSYERVTGAALHYYNLNKHPVELKNLFGNVPMYTFNKPNGQIKAQIEVLLNGIPLGEGIELEVYKFRHVDRFKDYYRYYSYVFKFYTTNGSLIVSFPWLGALDSGGAYSDLQFTDNKIKSVTDHGGTVKTFHYDIEYDKFENFFCLNSINIVNNLTPELEINQLKLPSFKAFGNDFKKEWDKFVRKFYQRNLRDAYGDIRRIVQDAMMITCVKKGIDFPEESNRNPNTLVGVLIQNHVLEGKFQEWTKAFTAFSNNGGHSIIEPTERDLEDLILRKRIVLVIMLGIQLMEELQKSLEQENFNTRIN